MRINRLRDYYELQLKVMIGLKETIRLITITVNK